MKRIAYHPSNFAKVKKLLRDSQNAQKSGANGRILFNSITKEFEFYEANELDKINQHASYTFVEDAINNYGKKDEEEMTEVRQMDEYATSDEVSVEENSENILATITDMSERISQNNREKMLSVISQLFKLDVVSESDILKTMLEHGEYRKLLSLLLAELGVEISYTRSGFDLTVSTAKIKFNKQAEYRIEDYRMGVVQAMPVINEIADSKNIIISKDEQIFNKDKIIGNHEKKIAELLAQIDVLTTQSKTQRDIKPILPIFYVIYFMEEGKQKFIKVDKNAKPTEDGSYPTKYLNKTGMLMNATKFSNSDALAQISKMVKFAKNVSFVDIKDKTPKELIGYFNMARVLVEKPESVTNPM